MPFIKRSTTKFGVPHLVIALAVTAIGVAAASDAFAAGHGGARGAGRVPSTLGGPVLGQAPSMSPTFNPSYRYVVPQAPEIPVSPASPGSVFGND
jgi:hypothetical protein